MISSALQALRAATSEAHSRLDKGLDLPRRLSGAGGRAALVARFQGFQAGIEAAIGPRLDARPGLTMRRRRRAGRFAADLAVLGARATPRPCPIPQAGSDAEALGMLYVSEGSTLGGKVITKSLAARGVPLAGLAFLDPYGADTGEMWRGVLAALAAEPDIDGLVRGGLTGFRHAELWLCGQEALA